MIKLKDLIEEGTCGYGVDGELGEEPAGPHLLKRKNEDKDIGHQDDEPNMLMSGYVSCYGDEIFEQSYQNSK